MIARQKSASATIPGGSWQNIVLIVAEAFAVVPAQARLRCNETRRGGLRRFGATRHIRMFQSVESAHVL